MRLGVFGGTFDPIHTGHLVAAHEVLRALRLDRVIFMPAGRPWQKRSYSDPEDRFAMTVLGTQGDPAFCVSRMEIDRKGPTYTADTMEVLNRFYGGSVELTFIAGMDAARNLKTWEGLDRLARLAGVVAVARPGVEELNWTAQPGHPEVRTLDIPGVDISATQIRKRAGAGESITGLVPEAVARYIVTRRLYARGDKIRDV